MRRREALAGLGSLLFPAPTFGQAARRVHRVAHVVFNTAYDKPNPWFEAMQQRFAELGFLQGSNLELRFFARRIDETTDLVRSRDELFREILQWKPDVMIAGTRSNAKYLKSQTTTIPIVFANLQDPEADGLVARLARPGGNVTGAAIHYDELTAKRLELVRELLPNARHVAFVVDRGSGGISSRSRALASDAANRLGLAFSEIDVRPLKGGLCSAATLVAKTGAQAILVYGNIEGPLNDVPGRHWGSRGYGECLTQLQRESRVPVLDDAVDSVPMGVAIALGEDQRDSYRRAADVAARILKGAKPADVPVDVQMRLQLFVNAASLREIGLTASETLRMRATRVID